MSANQGSAGNVIAALCSFFIPGLGQLIQGRLLAALVHFVINALCYSLWIVALGWLSIIISIFSAYDAAVFKPRN
jgi:TM2 domain-containing membrane protein YozV